MKVLIDTCVIIDALQNREPFADEAKEILRDVASKKINGFITAKSLTDIHYLYRKYVNNEKITRSVLETLIDLFYITDTTASDCTLALVSKTNDYEDAIMIETAFRSKMDYIVTRNTKDLRNSLVKVVTPTNLLKIV